MAITVTKTKPAKAAPKVEVDEAEVLVDPAEMTLEQLADQYGMMEEATKLILSNPIFTRFEDAKKELEKRLAEYDPLETVTVKGDIWRLDVGVAARNPGKVTDMKALAKILGQETFMKLAKVNLGDVEKYCTPEQVAKVVDTDTGYSKRRKIKTARVV